MGGLTAWRWTCMHASPADWLGDGLRWSLPLGHMVEAALAALHTDACACSPLRADLARPSPIYTLLRLQELEGELAAVEADPHSSTAALVGCAGGGAGDGAPAGAIASVDLAAGASRDPYVQAHVSQGSVQDGSC